MIKTKKNHVIRASYYVFKICAYFPDERSLPQTPDFVVPSVKTNGDPHPRHNIFRAIGAQSTEGPTDYRHPMSNVGNLTTCQLAEIGLAGPIVIC